MIGMRLVTHQTGPEGRIVKRVLVEEGLQIARELYLGLVIDRAAERPVMMVSPAGGMEIEKVAAETPELIYKEHVDPAAGLRAVPGAAARRSRSASTARRSSKAVEGDDARSTTRSSRTDASLVEINPLIVTAAGDLLALDAKMNFDDNALFRHPDISELRDLDEEDPLEIEASKFSLNYIRLDGNIGCMVNGAGLAMATMDIIKLAGGEPANFLDVGGGANAEQIRNAVRILMSDKNVRAVLHQHLRRHPAVRRPGRGRDRRGEGARRPGCRSSSGWKAPTWRKGKRMLRESGLNFTTADAMDEAAREVVKLAQ